MENFKAGDIVWEVSGSPKMSVKDSVFVDDNPNECIVRCTWFDGNKVSEHDFRAEQLTHTDPKSIPPEAAIMRG